MSTVFAERPSFFEGQYLGADDLEAFLKYAREYDARHLLGAHTWGIVAGIELVEGSTPTGEVEYFLTPGVAVDGYGRRLVVTAPYKLTTDLFAQQPSGTVNVWLRYEETPFSSTRTGFQSCECSDAFARVAESVVVEVGSRTTIDQRESGVVIGEQTFVDSRDALGDPLPNHPLACDGSVAAQTFPDAETRSLWLIPVGQVPWNKISSSLLASTGADKKASLIFRRVAGLVTGHIYPASGVIRLRPRWGTRQAGVSTDQICASSAIKEADLITCNGELSFREMIWLEGHSRFSGDARMYGSRLEFQEIQGTDYLNGGVPLALRRRLDRNEHHGFDLQVLLGAPQGTDGPTRLTIGETTALTGADPCAVDLQVDSAKPAVYIQHDAKVGIGTLNSLLSLPLTLRAVGDTGNLIGFEGADGTLSWKIDFGKNANGLNFTEPDSDPDEETRLFILTGGNVGIGTTTPAERLDVRGNIKLGAGGDFFGVGCLDNLRMVAGRVSDQGSRLSGSGYTCNRVGSDTGHYRVNFAPVVFSDTPVVVVTLVDAIIQDNAVTIAALSSTGFDVYVKDVAGTGQGEADLQDTAFNFIALGTRA